MIVYCGCTFLFPQSNAAIYNFAKQQYGANFPMFAKINVVGRDALDAWQYLVGKNLLLYFIILSLQFNCCLLIIWVIYIKNILCSWVCKEACT